MGSRGRRRRLAGRPGRGSPHDGGVLGLGDGSRLLSVALFHSGWGGFAEAPSGCSTRLSPLEENALGSPAATLCRMKMTYSSDKRGALPEGFIAEMSSQMEVGHSMK